ncbi:SLBB domain-containing protein [Flavicella sp.]|uniref:SLBB domain-containing protein n=1 Tax=Flavicella sp. TaxID=2957742 RepID=UPI0030186096
MKYWIYTVFIALFLSHSQTVFSQNMSANQMSSIDVDNLSDEQIANYWSQAQEQGYTINQLEVVAAAKGMSSVEISKLRQRISNLSVSEEATNNTDLRDDQNPFLISEEDPFGFLGGGDMEENEVNLLFGYDFFNNQNISFEPNMNMAIPKTYQIGPGDEILIDIWGAAENSYQKEVDRRGAIVIENIGPIYVSGLEIEKAKKKIITYLKKIYSGISAESSSFNKVYAEVSLVGIRTVQVNIIGEVEVPGTYSLSALSSVLNGLYAAGGPTENGSFRTIKLIRHGKEYSEFDIYKYLIEGSQSGNAFLQDKDVIIVKPYLSKIEVTGMVKRPGIYELTKEETVQDLIHYFSGFTAEAYRDRLIVDRVNGSQREVYEIDLKRDKIFTLQDGDSINVGEITDRYSNRVSINGAVYREGNYQLYEGLTLLDLIKKADGVKENVFLDRGLIYRTIDDVEEEVVPFSIENILKGIETVVLQREDSIQIYDKYSLKEEYTVSINGAVNNPIETQFREKMNVEDLILMAGGYKEGADPAVIDIARRIIDTNFTTLSENIKRSSTISLSLDSVETFYLKPFDKVSVRFIKGYSKKITASIQGEAVYPGSYVITSKDERVSDLLEKSGGLSPFAYVKGATLIRRTAKATDKEQLNLLQSLIVKDSMDLNIVEKTEYMIGIDLEKILSKGGRKSKYDLILREGDILLIPSEKQTVAVQGEVLIPSLIRFDESKSLKEYINNSGGFSEKAKKKKTYVVYANGDVKSTTSFLWIKKYPKLEPGAIILVPKSDPKSKMSSGEIIGISSALLSLALLVQQISN